MTFERAELLLERFRNASEEEQRRIINSMTPLDMAALDAWFEFWAHKNQLPPGGDAWRVWLMMAVTPLGDGRFHLARLLRGRMGTESAISGHALDEIFCLIEPGSLQPIVLPALSAGAEVTAQVPGGDSTSVTIGTNVQSIASPSGGMTIDAEARSSIDQILTNMRQRGLIGF